MVYLVSAKHSFSFRSENEEVDHGSDDRRVHRVRDDVAHQAGIFSRFFDRVHSGRAYNDYLEQGNVLGARVRRSGRRVEHITDRSALRNLPGVGRVGGRSGGRERTPVGVGGGNCGVRCGDLAVEERSHARIVEALTELIDQVLLGDDKRVGNVEQVEGDRDALASLDLDLLRDRVCALPSRIGHRRSAGSAAGPDASDLVGERGVLDGRVDGDLREVCGGRGEGGLVGDRDLPHGAVVGACDARFLAAQANVVNVIVERGGGHLPGEGPGGHFASVVAVI